MFRSLYTAASGMTAQQLNLDNIANNLANSSTAGFRSRRIQFQDMIYQNMVTPGAAATQQTTVAAGLQIGLGTRPGVSEVVQTQGEFSSTGNTLIWQSKVQDFSRWNAGRPDWLHALWVFHPGLPRQRRDRRWKSS